MQPRLELLLFLLRHTVWSSWWAHEAFLFYESEKEFSLAKNCQDGKMIDWKRSLTLEFNIFSAPKKTPALLTSHGDETKLTILIEGML